MNHFSVSIVKSIMRIVGCVFLILGFSPISFAVWFGISELLGIVEEIVDKRKE